MIPLILRMQRNVPLVDSVVRNNEVMLWTLRMNFKLFLITSGAAHPEPPPGEQEQSRECVT